MTYKEILDQIGEAAALEQTAEECAELAHACLKMARKFRAENPTPAAEDVISEQIHEELADLMTCVDIMINFPWINPKKVQDIQNRKTRRWGERLEEVVSYGKDQDPGGEQ